MEISRTRPVATGAVEALRAHLRERSYPTGAFLDSETALAETLGVSRGTIRIAIDALVATGELTRRPHSRPLIGLPREVTPSKERLDVYVWVSHPISDSASLSFMKGVSLGLRGTPYRLIVREPTRFFGDYVPSDERQFLKDVLEDEGAAGAIVQRDACAQNNALMEELLKAGKPLVFVDSPPPLGIAADYVGTANLTAARRCVEHLIEFGHQRIACLVESDVAEVVRQRIHGYWRALRHAGLASQGNCLIAVDLESPETLFRPRGNFASRCAIQGAYAEWSQRLVSTVMAMPERPTALFVGCDVLATSVAALLEGAGLSIPDDISIVGFDWLARWEGAQVDDLTTASQDFEGFGHHAADVLLDRLSGNAPSAPRHVLLPAPLVVRSSTAARPVTKPTNVSGDVALINS